MINLYGLRKKADHFRIRPKAVFGTSKRALANELLSWPKGWVARKAKEPTSLIRLEDKAVSCRQIKETYPFRRIGFFIGGKMYIRSYNIVDIMLIAAIICLLLSVYIPYMLGVSQEVEYIEACLDISPFTESFFKIIIKQQSLPEHTDGRSGYTFV